MCDLIPVIYGDLLIVLFVLNGLSGKQILLEMRVPYSVAVKDFHINVKYFDRWCCLVDKR